MKSAKVKITFDLKLDVEYEVLVKRGINPKVVSSLTKVEDVERATRDAVCELIRSSRKHEIMLGPVKSRKYDIMSWSVRCGCNESYIRRIRRRR